MRPVYVSLADELVGSTLLQCERRVAPFVYAIYVTSSGMVYLRGLLQPPGPQLGQQRHATPTVSLGGRAVFPCFAIYYAC